MAAIRFIKKAFVWAGYYRDAASGRMLPDRSGERRCPSSEPGHTCSFVLKSYRDRISGPYPLAVLKCLIHHVCFTAYPLGWLPYGRKPLADEGLFQAAIDASKNILWPDLADNPDKNQTRPTQVRHITIAAHLFGYFADQNGKYHVAQRLGLNVNEFAQLNQKVRDGPKTRRRWGAWIADILGSLRSKPTPMLDFAWCGVRAGLWPAPLVWNPSDFACVPSS